MTKAREQFKQELNEKMKRERKINFVERFNHRTQAMMDAIQQLHHHYEITQQDYDNNQQDYHNNQQDSTTLITTKPTMRTTKFTVTTTRLNKNLNDAHVWESGTK